MLELILFLVSLQVPTPRTSKDVQHALHPHPLSRAQALSPQETELAFSVDDGTVRFLVLPEGKVRLEVSGFSTGVVCLSWSAAGEAVAAVGIQGEVRIVDARDGHRVSEFDSSAGFAPSLGEEARAITFVDGGSKLLLAGGKSPSQLRERDDGKLVARIQLESKKPITASCVSRDGLHFALGDQAGWVATYSARTGEIESGPYSVPPPVNALAFDLGAKHLAVGSGDCRVRVFLLQSKEAPVSLSHCDEDLSGDLEIGSVEFSGDGEKVLSTSFSFWEVRLWDLKREAVLWRRDYGGGNPVAISAGFASDSSRVVCSQKGWIVDAHSGEIERKLDEETTFRQWSMDGFYAWRSKTSKLIVRDVRDGRVVAELGLERRESR